MKRLIALTLIITGTASCGNSTRDSIPNARKTASAADTITSVTNPGVGSAADDTAKRP